MPQVKHMRDDLRLLEEKKTEYYNVLRQSGSGHRAAEKWQDPTPEIEHNLRVAQTQAEDRFNLAIDKLHEEKRIEELTKHETEERMKEVRNVENMRAALIASLPPPKNTLLEKDLASTVEKEPLVLVYDAEAKNTLHSQNLPSKVIINNDRKDENETVDDKERYNATISAHKEEERIQAVERVNAIHANEDLIKADMRGRQAMRKERIRQHYQALLHRLDEVGRNEILLRRSQLYSGTAGGNSLPGGPKDAAVLNRRLEKVFEDEILYQLANSNHNDAYLTDNINEEVSVDHGIMNTGQPVSSVIDEECIPPPAPPMEDSVDEGIPLPNEKDVELNKNDTITPDEDYSSLKETSLSTTTEQQSTQPVDLGPGERPILPDIRRCRIRSGSLALDTPKSITSKLRTPLEHSSFEEKHTTGGGNVTMTTTDDESVQLRQRLLEDELEMIDRRINRLRFSSVWESSDQGDHQQMDSLKSTDESITETNKSKRNIIITTPRNIYPIEGCLNHEKTLDSVQSTSDASSNSESKLSTVRCRRQEQEPQQRQPALPPSSSLPKSTNVMKINASSFDSMQTGQDALDINTGKTVSSTLVKYHISQPITGILAERARCLVNAQKAEILKRKAIITSLPEQSSLYSYDQVGDDKKDSKYSSSASPAPLSSSSSSSSSSVKVSKQAVGVASMTTSLESLSDGQQIHGDECLMKPSLQKNKSAYESSTVTQSTPIVTSSNKYEKPHCSESDQDELYHSNNNEMIIADDVVTHLEDKTLNPLISLEASPCMDDLQSVDDTGFSKKSYEPSNNLHISNEAYEDPSKSPRQLNLPTPPPLTPPPPPPCTSSSSAVQLESFVNTTPANILSQPQITSPVSSSSRLSSTSPSPASITSPSSIESTKPASVSNSSENKPQSSSESCISDTLKAELKALLTSSLINSLISSQTSGLSETSDLYKLISSQSFLLSSVLSSRGQNATKQTTLNHISSLTKSSSIDNETIQPVVTSASSISSPHLSQSSSSQYPVKGEQLTESSDIEKNNNASDFQSIVRPSGDGNAENSLTNQNSSNDSPLNVDLIKSIKKRVLNKYISANKDRLLNLSNLNRSKVISSPSLQSSSPATTSTRTGSNREFHSLSEVTNTDEINWSEAQCESHESRTKQTSDLNKSSKLSRNDENGYLLSQIPNTPSSNNHSIGGVRFKPLPRLDEDNSEESVHTVQVTSDFINLSNTPSSWTDSRKSSEFGYLSSTTYSPPENVLENKLDGQQDHIVTTAETPSQLQQQSASPQASSKEEVPADGGADGDDDDDGDNDTVRQLRANIPYTPVEPSEAEIAPCLGSRLSIVSLDKLENLVSAPAEGKNTFKRTMEYSTTTTTTTTVMDSSSIWEKSSSGIQETVRTLGSRIVNSTDGRDEISVDNMNNTVTMNDEKEIDTSHYNPRPSSPAEGAASEFSHQYHHHNHRHQYYQNASSISSFSSSLPCVFVKDFQSSDEVYEMKNDTIATPHYASDSNLKLCSQTEVVVKDISLTASLLSFQQNETRCNELYTSQSSEIVKNMKDQFLDASPESISAKDVVLNADMLVNISAKIKSSTAPNKHSLNKQTLKDSSSKPANRVHNELRMVKASTGGKSQTSSSTAHVLPRQKPAGRGFLQSSASLVQTSMKNKFQSTGIPHVQQKMLRPSSSIPITSKSHTQSSSTIRSSIKRQPLVSVDAPPVRRIGTSVSSSSSSGCRKLNPIDQAKTLRMELAQWQRKRLGQRNEAVSEKATTSPPLTPPPTTTTTTAISASDSPPHTIQASSACSGDPVVDRNTTGEHVPQTEDNQLYTEAAGPVEPTFTSTTNQLLIDLTLNTTTKHSPNSYSVDMDATDSPVLIGSSGEGEVEGEVVFKQPPEMMNIPVQSSSSSSSEVKVSPEVSIHFSQDKKVTDNRSDNVKHADNLDCVKVDQSNTSSSHLPSKLRKENNSALCTSDRHKRALVNRSRVKEYDRIRREQLMKRRL
ncbi:unnamed protein product [Trichobilharzia szidati]|nr:unnamed protein product [Trichobilharzia szidati]